MGLLKVLFQGSSLHHDVAALHGNSPAVLIHGVGMNTAGSKKVRLNPGFSRTNAPLLLWKMKLTMDFVARLMTEVNDIHHQTGACESRKNSLANEDEALRKFPFCFLSLGSEGSCKNNAPLQTRQLPMVYEDVPGKL